jgi:glycosyltransferase involved in cell wall biosynthesis
LSSPELVSVVIPTLNRPELLRKAVLSALSQTYSQIEVVVVIDGEDPASEETLASINDERLRLIPLVLNLGGSEARNIGVRKAKGSWIAFLDDDDEWLPQKIALQMEAAKASQSPWPVISSRLIVRTPERDFIRPTQRIDSRLPVSEQLFCRRTLADGPYTMQTSTLLTRRETLLTIPFRSGLQRHQDWDWLLRAARDPKVSFHVLSEPLTVFRINDDRKSVGRSVDWQFSLRWVQEMRRYFTPKAYSFFVATECVARAVKAEAGFPVYWRLIREFASRGSPDARSLIWLAGFLFVPQRWRSNVRKLLANSALTGRGPAIRSRPTQFRSETTLLLSNELNITHRSDHAAVRVHAEIS